VRGLSVEVGESVLALTRFGTDGRENPTTIVSFALGSGAMGKKSRRDAQQLEEQQAALAATKAAEAKAAKRALAAAKEAVVKTAPQVTPVATVAIKAVEVAPVVPVVEAVKKPKKARFVREITAKKAPPKDAPLPPRNATTAGKMMSKNVTLRPKEEHNSGPKDDRATKPKPKP